MDIGDNKMEKIDLKDIKTIAQEICQKYFFKKENCTEKVESTLLEISNMNDYDEEQFFTLFSVAPILFLNKQGNVIATYAYIASALQQSINLTKGLTHTKYLDFIPPHLEEMCQNYTKNKERCIDEVDRMLFLHMMTMNALTYLRKSAPLDSEFVYLLFHLMENISVQYVASGSQEHAEKLIETAKMYLDLLSKEIKNMKINDKK
jgi:hypothetical protein